MIVAHQRRSVGAALETGKRAPPAWIATATLPKVQKRWATTAICMRASRLERPHPRSTGFLDEGKPDER